MGARGLGSWVNAQCAPQLLSWCGHPGLCERSNFISICKVCGVDTAINWLVSRAAQHHVSQLVAAGEVSFGVVATKTDLRPHYHNPVWTSEGEAFARQIGALGYWEVTTDDFQTHKHCLRDLTSRFIAKHEKKLHNVGEWESRRIWRLFLNPNRICWSGQ